MKYIESENLRDIVEGMIKSVIERQVLHILQNEEMENWNLQGIVDYVNANLLPEDDVTVDDLRGKDSRRNDRTDL